MQKYRYAYDRDNQIRDVTTLDSETAKGLGPYTCISCGNLLVARLGEKRIKHFAHKHVVECNGETYLHKLGKAIFVQEYRKCLDLGQPFSIGMTHKIDCDKYREIKAHNCTQSVVEWHDLTEIYKGIAIEHQDGDYIPDILLFDESDGQRKLYIEIKVTHASSAKKVGSKTRIIEIPLDTDEDVTIFYSHHIEQGKGIKFFNFNPKPKKPSDRECLCENQVYYCFVVYPSEKCVMPSYKLRDLPAAIKRLENSEAYFTVTSAKGRDASYLFVDELKNAVRSQGLSIKNCALCMHARKNWHNDDGKKPVYCSARKIRCNTNEAVTCSQYTLMLR